MFTSVAGDFIDHWLLCNKPPKLNVFKQQSFILTHAPMSRLTFSYSRLSSPGPDSRFQVGSRFPPGVFHFPHISGLARSCSFHGNGRSAIEHMHANVCMCFCLCHVC